jgi:hypothetical protein
MSKRQKGSRSEYDEALQRAADGAGERLEEIFREIGEAAQRFAELISAQAPERRDLIQAAPRFHSLKLCELFQAKSARLNPEMRFQEQS